MFLAALAFAVAISASAAAAPAGAAGAAAPPDSTYNYTITKGTDTIGKSSVTIKRADVGLTVHETETLQPDFSYTIDEILDTATLAPKAYSGIYARGTDLHTVVRAGFDRSGATVTFEGLQGTSSLPNPPGIKTVYALEDVLMTGFALLPAQIHASRAAQFSIIQPRHVLQYVGRVEQRSSAVRPSGVPASDIDLAITGQMNFDEWYDPATFVLHALSMPSQQILITLTK